MIGLIWTLIGAILLGFYNGLLVLDDKTPESDRKNSEIEDGWHVLGATVFIYLSITVGMMYGWKYVPFSLSCFWCVFAGIVHRIGLNRPFFFVGTTAKTDKLLRKISSKKPELASAIIKISVMIASVVLLFL